MPSKYRLIEEKIKELVSRKLQFENELKEAALSLERVQNAVVKGTADTDALVAAQTRVNAIGQTISVFDSQLHALENDLLVQRQLDAKKDIISKIKVLDTEAETIISLFLEFYTDLPNLNFIRFEEMGFMLEKIQSLKSAFAAHVNELIPNVNRLKRQNLPELENDLDSLITELEVNGCKLSALRATGLFFKYEYATDDDFAFTLPDTPLADWIWLSIRTAKDRADRYGRLSEPDLTEKKTGFFQQIFN